VSRLPKAAFCGHPFEQLLRFKEVLDQRKLLRADVRRYDEVFSKYTQGIQALSLAEKKFEKGHFRTAMKALKQAQPNTVPNRQFAREREALDALSLRDFG